MKTFLSLTVFVLATLASPIVAEEEVPSARVQLRFVGSDPGPQIEGISVDDTEAIGLTKNRRFMLLVNLRGPNDTAKRSPTKALYRARAQIVEQSLKMKGEKEEWMNVATIGSTEWLKLEPTIDIHKGGPRLRGKTTESSHSKERVDRKAIEISLNITLEDDRVLIAEATATWGDRSADTEWEHEVTAGRNVGVTHEVDPVVGADGIPIDLNSDPETVEFEGFVNYGSPITTGGTDVNGNPTQVVLTG